jgi:nicotinate-nucleotide adenylyltransferase
LRIGVFGGTFNPIHYGHLRAAEEVREMLAFERVLFVPSGTPPLKTEGLEDAQKRLEMARLAIAGNKAFEVLDIECRKPKKSYTVETMEVLLKLYDGAELYFMLGVDAFLDIPNWWKPEKLMSMVNFAVLARPGRSFIDLLSSPYMAVEREILKELDGGDRKSLTLGLKSLKEAVLVKITPLDISSSGIRRSIGEGLSIKYLLPENVESFIISHMLYSPVASRRESKRKEGKTFKK